MGLNQVTQEHIAQTLRELESDPRVLTKKMLARVRNENLYYAILVEGLAARAKKHLAAAGVPEISDLGKEVQRLMSEMGMFCYRVLELAALSGAPANNAIMSDPNFGASSERADAALEEAQLLIMKIKLLDSNRGEEA